MDKRRFTRIDFAINALVTCDDAAFRGAVENLSLHGIFINTDKNLPMGAKVAITICLTEMEPEIVINLSAKTVRIMDSGIGFEFEKMDIDSFTHLRSIISYRKGDADSVMNEFADYVESHVRNEE